MIIERYEHPVDWVAPEPSDPILKELGWILDDPELLHFTNTLCEPITKARERGATPSRWKSAIA